MPADAYLSDIVEAHRERASSAPADLSTLAESASKATPPRDFRDALRRAPGLAVIAEIKRRSPSKGDIAPGLDPVVVAREYEAGGATCVSVLTDVAYFGGSRSDLVAARGSCNLPVLRKDFTVCEPDVYEARSMGADAVLLIVAALSDSELSRFKELATSLGMAALVEVHDAFELRRALQAGADLIGVNQRDLRTFEVDRHRAEELAVSIPPEVTAVAESGISGVGDATRLADAGYRAVLVGESLIRSGDRRGAVAKLAGIKIHSARSATTRPPTTATSRAVHAEGAQG